MPTDRLLTASLAIAFAASAQAQTHVYVDDDAQPGGDGLTWQTAFNDLHNAIDLAKALGQARGEIRIAGGTYKPDRGTGDQQLSFQIPIEHPGDTPYRLRGGFAGLEMPTSPDVQHPLNYPSVLDADLLGDDATTGNIRDNAGTILVIGEESNPSVSTTSAIILEGLTLRGAAFNAVRAPVSSVSLVLRDCNFSENLGGTGAVLGLKNAFVTIDHCKFMNNEAVYVVPGNQAGGVLNLELCQAHITDSIFEGNRQTGDNRSDAVGAAISVRDSNIRIVESQFRSNTADHSGGAIYSEGSFATIHHTEFVSNRTLGGSGGAIYVTSDVGSSLTLHGCVFEQNIADDVGGAVYSVNQARVTGSTFVSNSAHSGGAFVGRIDAYDSEFIGNHTNSTGGALQLITGTVIDGCFFSGNTSNSGGAIDMSTTNQNPLTTRIQNSVFEKNEAMHRGGAIRDPFTTHNDGDVIVKDCHFSHNNSFSFGGAISGTNAIIGSSFEGNTSTQGGGAVVAAEFIDGCTFVANSTQSAGGALLDPFAIARSLFVDNKAAAGGFAIDAKNRDITIVDSAFIHNTKENDTPYVMISKTGTGNLDLIRSTLTGVLASGSRFIELTGGDHWIESSILWSRGLNEPSVSASKVERIVVTHSNLNHNAIEIDDPDTYFYLGGNLFLDPMFEDAVNGNIRLMPSSPCIDAGLTFDDIDPGATDIYGDSRIPFDAPGMPNSGQGAGGYLDIGAVEFQGTSCFADTNFDGNLTPADFSAWVSAYNRGDFIADQNRDGVITPSDFSAWVSNYNTGCP